jgi:hypothetical protein
MNWIDYPGGSIRSDGAKVGEFVINGRVEWWGYPAGWVPRGSTCGDPAGPFNYRHDAKAAMDASLLYGAP